MLGRQINPKDIEHFIVFSALFLAAWLWLSFVNVYVPEPYLVSVGDSHNLHGT